MTQCWWPPGRAIYDSHVYLTFSAVFHGWREHKRRLFLFFCRTEWSGVISREGFSGVLCVGVCVCENVRALPVGCSSHSKCLRKKTSVLHLVTFQTSQHISCMVNLLLRKQERKERQRRKERKTIFWSIVFFFMKFRPDENTMRIWLVNLLSAVLHTSACWDYAFFTVTFVSILVWFWVTLFLFLYQGKLIFCGITVPFWFP